MLPHGVTYPQIVDASRHNGPFSMDAFIKDDPKDPMACLVHRSTIGLWRIDDRWKIFADCIPALHSIQVGTGAYHLLWPSQDPIKQVHYFVRSLPIDKPKLVVLDCEVKRDDNGSPLFTYKTVIDCTYEAARELDLLGFRCVIYTNPDYARMYYSRSGKREKWIGNNTDLWLAAWNALQAIPAAPAPWKYPIMHQFNTWTPAPGWKDKTMDRSRFFGTPDDFLSYMGFNGPPVDYRDLPGFVSENK